MCGMSKGGSARTDEHIAREKINGIERGAAYLLSKVSLIGPHTRQWAEAMVGARGIEGTRVLLGLLSLTKKHPSESLEKACEIALSHGAFRLRTIRQLLKRRRVQAGAAAVPGRASDHPPAGRLRPSRRRGARTERPRSGSSPSEGFERHGSGVQWPRRESRKPRRRTATRASVRHSTRPRSGYPLSGCSSAEPDSVSPDSSSVRSSPPRPGVRYR